MGFLSFFYKYFVAAATAGFLAIASPFISIQRDLPNTGNLVENLAFVEDVTRISLQDFVESVKDGHTEAVKGLYAEKVFSLRVIQQPDDQPGFVSAAKGVATQFGMAASNNITGMLAHNYLAGAAFFDLNKTDTVNVIYGNGSIRQYQVTEIKKYQALTPKSTSSEFVDLDTGEKISALRLFTRMYTGKHRLVLQTCIQVGDEDSWGRLFVIAQPAE
ncbi:MAG: hypothetical protein GYA15_01025 [Leptolinea sp.]|jgi:hypothetical protein|nr:hypothetical protein [Leptolinea sp.]